MYSGIVPSLIPALGKQKHGIHNEILSQKENNQKDPLGRVLVQNALDLKNPQHRVNQVEKLHTFSPDPCRVGVGGRGGKN